MNKKISKNNFNKLVCTFIILIFNLLPIYSYTYAVPASSASDTDSLNTAPVENSPSYTDSSSNNLTLYSKADILMDMNTGNILYEKNSADKLYPASTTKLMTAILTMENCQLTDTVTIKKEWLSRYPTNLHYCKLTAWRDSYS